MAVGRVHMDRRPPLSLCAAILAVICLGLGAYHAAGALESSSLASDDPVELALFPHGPWVRPAMLGRHRVAADVAWLRAIQYYGKHRATDRSYPYAWTLFRTMTDLDPQFVNAYVFGALVLAEDQDDMEGAQRLLRDGMAANPGHWILPFEYGFLAYVHGGDMATAAEYLAAAARLPDAPPSAGRLAAYAAGRAGEVDFAIELWREMLRHSDNDEIRRTARRYLKELGAPEAADWPEEELG